MKKAISILVLLLACLNCTAQKNWISVTINDYSSFNADRITDDTFDVVDNRGLILLPSVGFYRLLDGDFGIGCEIGYGTQKSHFSSRANFSDEIDFYEAKSRLQVFYVCPTVFEIFRWKKYQLSASVTVPLEYHMVTENSAYREFTRKATNNIYFQRFDEQESPNFLNFGIFCNLRAQRRIYKNLYLGPQLGFGLMGKRNFGNTINKTIITLNGETEEYQSETETSKNIAARFDIRPSFSISYNF